MENGIAADFTPGYFRVIVKKDGQLHLAQTYAYTTPLDVVYFLLKICSEFGLSQEQSTLSISGLVEKESALYRELYNYFLNIQFRNPAQPDLPDGHPAHFFTSISNLAVCAS